MNPDPSRGTPPDSSAPAVAPALTDAEENELLKRTSETDFQIVLVASDLHLGPGWSPRDRRIDPTENFFADGAFSRWLEAHRTLSSPMLLVLNGDVLDFTRIGKVPRGPDDYSRWSERLARLGKQVSPGELEGSLSDGEKEFGLRTNDYKSVWKLHVVTDGHPGFVKALARWLEAGHTLLVLKGNHDLEFHWPLIRRAFRDELAQVMEGTEAVASRVVFSETDFTRENLLFEHGHLYEPMTRVNGSAVLDTDPEQLRYPLGSFMNRYIVNKIERFDPFIDNIKPVQNAVLALLRRYPLAMLRLYRKAWRFLWRAIRVGRGPNWPTFFIGVGLVAPIVTVVVALVLILWPASWAWLSSHLPFLTTRRAAGVGAVGVLFPFLMPYLLGAAFETARSLGFMKSVDHVAEGARDRLRDAPSGGPYRRIYAVMGHTHKQDVRQFEAGPPEKFYVNTGTWIPLWPETRRDLIGRVVYSFARFDLAEGEYVHRAQEWDDAAGQAREAKIFAFGGEPSK